MNSINNADIARMFLVARRLKVTKSKLNIKGNTYTLQERDLVNRYNRAYVKVRYDEDDLSTIRMYTDREDKFVCQLEIDNKATTVNVNEKSNFKLIANHSKFREELLRLNILDFAGDIELAQKELEKIPIQLFHPTEQLNRILEFADDDLTLATMIKKLLGSKLKSRSAKIERITPNRGYEAKKSGSLKIIN